ncbi:hypothetical protein PilKf_01182 [Pillotina sp. SPG140]
MSAAISAAEALRDETLISEDGADLPINIGYVTSAQWAAYQSFIAAAKTVLNDPQATQAAINSALSTLSTATAAFTDAKDSQHGLKKITLSGTINATIDGNNALSISLSIYDGDTSLGGTYISNYSTNTDWTVYIPPVTRTTTLTFKADILKSVDPNNGSGEWYSDIDVTPNPTVTVTSTDTEKTGINLTAAVTSVTLSGSLNVSVDGETVTSVSIQARTTDTNTYLGSVYYSSPIPETWELSIPSSATERTVDVSVWFTTVSDEHYSGDTETVTLPAGQGKSDIALTARVLTVSGTFGTVSVDGNPPLRIQLMAFDASTNPTGDGVGGGWLSDGAYSDNMAWSIPIHIKSGDPITLAYVVQIECENYAVFLYKLPTTTTPITTASVSGVQLENITLTTKTVTGTINGLIGGDNENYGVQVMLLSKPISNTRDIGVSDLIAFAYLDTGKNTLTFKANSTTSTSTFYVLAANYAEDASNENDAIFKISGPLTGTSFNVNWATMTPVQGY